MVKRLMAKDSKNWTSAAARRLLSLAGNPGSMQEAIDIIANHLLKGISCPPTDLDAIMPRLNVTRSESDADMPVSGELRREGANLKIVFSSHLSPTRKRWTIAHELGHAVFETSGANCPRYGKELERLCDMLATEILLPKQHFRPLLDSSTDVEKVLALARVFKTSVSATAIRCAELTGLSVFEMEANHLLWGYGIISRGRRVEKDIAFKQAVTRAMRAESGNELVVLSTRNQTGRWLMEWKCLGRRQRALFILRKTT